MQQDSCSRLSLKEFRQPAATLPLMLLSAILALFLLASDVSAAKRSGFAAAPLSNGEVQTMQFMREEEKLARDVYRILFAEWGNQVFSNISASEQSHMDAVGKLLDTYRVADPVSDDRVGVFVDPDLQQLFDDLTSRGAASEIEALLVGAFIEETDMVDLAAAIEQTTHTDIANVYANLLRGSRNHLRAFVSQLESLGLVYEAQVISAEQLDAIIFTPMERAR